MKKRKQVMNSEKLLTIALCMMVCFTTTMVFADDDFGIVSATPIVIKDPINPQPGMIFNAYAFIDNMRESQLKESHTILPNMASKKTGVDKNEKFGYEVTDDVNSAGIIRWEGFLKCKRAAKYTFLFQKKEENGINNGYSVKINGQYVIPATCGQKACDVNLKIGWNKVEIVCLFYDGGRRQPLNISFRPKDSLATPRPITPKDLFHDQKPEEDW